MDRSGSFIMINFVRRPFLRYDSLNIYAHLKHIREQRTRLVQTLDQYVFIHSVVWELINTASSANQSLTSPTT